MTNDFDAIKVKDACAQWIRDWFKTNGDGCNAVIGISGGKDSSIVAALCCEAIGKDRVIGVLIDEPVAVSTQDGRKCSEDFEWFGPEAVKKVKNYILSLIGEDDPHVKYGDLEQDIGDHYSIEFNAQVLDWSKAKYNGQPFKMLSRVKETPDYGIDTNVVIELPDGSAKVVNVRDIEFMFHVKP